MFPLIVITSPENGSENVSLDEVIKITFDGELDPDTVTTDNVKLINYTTDDEVLGTTVELVDSDSAIRITAPATSTGGHRFEGLNEYRVLISGVESVDGYQMDGTFQLRFSVTSNSIDEVIDQPGSTELFEVLKVYPKQNAVVTPSVIKIQCSDVIDPSSDLDGIMLLQDESIMSVDDAIFTGANLITTSDITISNDTIIITIPTDFEWKSGEPYSVVVKGIENMDGVTILPYMYTFHAAFSPLYATIASVKGSRAVVGIMTDMSDLDISIKINANSELAEFIATQAEQTIALWAEDLPLYVSEYVKYKTQYDIIFDKFIEMSSGPTMKQLKDLTVEYGYSMADLLKLADRLKLEYKYWEDFLKGQKNRGNASPGVFQKGSNADTTPDFMNRQLKDMEGGKTW